MEPYSFILAALAIVDLVDCTFMLGNEAIFEICQRNLNVSRSSYIHMNA